MGIFIWHKRHAVTIFAINSHLQIRFEGKDEDEAPPVIHVDRAARGKRYRRVCFARPRGSPTPALLTA